MGILSDLKVGERLEIEVREYDQSHHAIVSQLIDIKEDSAFIVNPIKQGVSYPLSVGQRVKIIFNREDRGIYRFLAEVKKRIQRSLTIYEIVPVGEIEKIQRRYYYRLDAVLKLQIKLSDEEVIDAVTKDISGGGIKVFANTAIPAGTKVSCKLFLRDDESIEVKGVVVRCYRDPELKEHVIGVSFNDIPEGIRSKIISFIFEKQRLLRKKGLI